MTHYLLMNLVSDLNLYSFKDVFPQLFEDSEECRLAFGLL